MSSPRIRASAIVGAGVLAAVAAGAGAARADARPQGDGGVTIVHWQHQSDAREALINQFIESYGDVSDTKIEFESIPYSDYFVRLGAALEAGNGPCVFQLPANIVAEFQGRGQLAPVPDSVMTADDVAATFAPAATSLLQVDGVYYGLPTDVQTLLLFYNDDLFEAAGLDPTKDFATWDEFREAAKALTVRDGDNLMQAGVDIASTPYQWYYTAPTLAFPDGQVSDETGLVNYDSQPGYDVWQRLTDLVTVDGVDAPDFLADQNKFSAGLAGMSLREYTFTGVFELTAPDVNFSVHLPPPVADETYGNVATTSWSYVVSSDCADQDEAWAWISYLTSEDSQRIWVTQGGELPSRLTLLDDAALLDDPSLAVAIPSLDGAMSYDSRGWDDVFGIQQSIWDDIVLNGTDVQTAVDAGAATENALYATKGSSE